MHPLTEWELFCQMLWMMVRSSHLHRLWDHSYLLNGIMHSWINRLWQLCMCDQVPAETSRPPIQDCLRPQAPHVYCQSDRIFSHNGTWLLSALSINTQHMQLPHSVQTWEEACQCKCSQPSSTSWSPNRCIIGWWQCGNDGVPKGLTCECPLLES